MHARNSNYNWTDENGVEHKDPLRPGDSKDHLRQALSGEVLSLDAERRYIPWLERNIKGFKSSGLSADTQLGADLGSPLRWDDIGKGDLKNTTLGKGLSKLKDLFD